MSTTNTEFLARALQAAVEEGALPASSLDRIRCELQDAAMGIHLGQPNGEAVGVLGRKADVLLSLAHAIEECAFRAAGGRTS